MNSTLFKHKAWVLAFSVLAIVMLGLAIIGGFLSYSPVPYWDMWDGYLGFFIKVSEGDVTAWWAQHNEHRIILARLLFWLDLSWFQGSVWLLIVVNYLLMGLAYLFFSLFLKEQLNKKEEFFSRKILSLVMLAMLFAWIQKNNLTWGFQSQFILAQLLPLIAFFLLHRSFTNSTPAKGLFFLACLVGTLSVGTMANGVLTLPLMILLALVLRLSWQRIAVLVVLGIAATALYFYDYHTLDNHGSLKEALINNPVGLLQYVLLYIGGPIYYLTGQGSQAIAQLTGVFLIASAVFFTWQSVNQYSKSSLQLALLTFLLYVGGTALGTGGGRLIFGVEQALSGRYQTPALMAWVALLILYAPMIARCINRHPPRILLPLLFVPLLLLPEQFKAVHSQQSTLFERQVAALALELGIKDQEQILSIFPSAEWALFIAKIPAELDLSIFGQPNIKNVNRLIGQSSKTRSPVQCLGSLDEINNIDGQSKYVRIRGWIYQNEAKETPRVVHLLDKEGRIVGYALTGQPRPDVEAAINTKVIESGFKGYLLAQQLGQPVILRGYHPGCELIVKAPLKPFVVKQAEWDKSEVSVLRDQVAGLNEWTGTDSHRTKVDGFQILGSFIYGDQDIGSISLQLKKGDSLYFRSGPTGGKQSLFIESEKEFSQVLPVVTDWVLLEFKNSQLPETFTIQIVDSGSEWGEWSAIAVRN